MKIVSRLSPALVGLAFLVVNALPADAQNLRSWVSHNGNNANPCTSTAPCATFSFALSQTVAGGSINCLDAGDFGAVTITKSITVDCLGTVGGIAPGGLNGVDITALATDTVILRGLTIDGVGAHTGVAVTSVGVLRIDHCKISGFNIAPATGVNFAVPSGFGSELHVTNSLISENGIADDGRRNRRYSYGHRHHAGLPHPRGEQLRR
jgi:hypothetical protein